MGLDKKGRWVSRWGLRGRAPRGRRGVSWRNPSGCNQKGGILPDSSYKKQDSKTCPWGSSLSMGTPPSLPTHFPRMALTPGQDRRTHKGLQLLPVCTESTCGGAQGLPKVEASGSFREEP